MTDSIPENPIPGPKLMSDIERQMAKRRIREHIDSLSDISRKRLEKTVNAETASPDPEKPAA